MTLASAPSGAARKPLHWWTEAELGVELDTNATRLDSVAATGDPVMSALLRGHAQLGLRWRPLETFLVGGSYDLAGKVFFSDRARSQDTLIHRVDASLGVRLGRGLLGQLTGIYHEGFQREPQASDLSAALFDFRLLDGRAVLVLAPGDHLVASVGVGLQRFTYKPSQAISFDSALGAFSLESSWNLGRGARESELELSFAYSIAERRYGARLELLCTTQDCLDRCLADPECDPEQPMTYTYRAASRTDLAQRLQFGLTWVGPVLLSATYVLVSSRSNSYGLGYLLHDLTGKLVAPLVWKLYGTLQFRLRLLSTEVPGALEELALGFEEENRSHMLVQIERSLYKRLKAILRYTLFVGDLEHPRGDTLRHLLFLGLAFRYDGK
ncbi:MAG: hypothetical protein RBU30_02815 [Polyangia bacterium]|jgi:hypothetical protein|nr:hypothetical protein [Polyangia bacterium]